jgi:Ca2+-binding RTX toxin-like protein
LKRKLVGPAATAEWLRYVEVGAPMDPNDIVREAVRFDVAGHPTTFGNDYIQGDAGDDHQWGQDGNDTMHGNTENDDMFGELGDDQMFGEEGEDAMVGDRGGVVDRLVDGSAGDPTGIPHDIIAPPAIEFHPWRDHPLDRRVDLLHDQNADGTGFLSTTLDKHGRDFGGADYMRGGPDHDSMHGAFGADVMNGDSGGDILFGEDGADAIWGGKGCDPELGDVCPDGLDSRGELKNADGTYADDTYLDYTFGGYGAPGAGDTALGSDFLDYRPRPGGIDPVIWYEATNTRASDPLGAHQHHQGIDWIYGGWDRDVMQANVADNGPNPGDRLLDWSGAYNLYTHCNAAYGGFNDVREFSPQHQDFLQKLAYALGAGPTMNDVLTSNNSGFRELALVYSKDVKQNTGKAFPTTPGHFDNFSCEP